MGDPLKGIKVKLGPDEVTLVLPLSAMRIVHKACPGRSVNDLLKDLSDFNVDVIAVVGAAGLLGRGQYTDDRVLMILDGNPEQLPDFAAACMAAMNESYARVLPTDTRKRLGEELGAARGKAPTQGTPSTPMSPTDGPTGTSSSEPAAGSA